MKRARRLASAFVKRKMRTEEDEHVQLLGSSRNLRLVRFGLPDSHSLLVVSVDGVVCLPLPLGRLDPEHSQSLLLQNPKRDGVSEREDASNDERE